MSEDLAKRIVRHPMWARLGGWQSGMVETNGEAFCLCNDQDDFAGDLPDIHNPATMGHLLAWCRRMAGGDDVRVYRTSTGRWVAQALHRGYVVRRAAGGSTEGKAIARLWVALAEQNEAA